jgi:cytochrome c oxidase subunit II
MKGCNACHTLDRTRGVGPSFVDVYGYERRFTDGTSLIADENYIRESILDPGALIVETYPNQMQSYQGRVTDEELEALIAFIRSLSDRAPPEELPSEDDGQEPQQN